MSLVTVARWAQRQDPNCWERRVEKLFEGIVRPAARRGRPAVAMQCWGVPIVQRWPGIDGEVDCTEVDGGWVFDLDADHTVAWRGVDVLPKELDGLVVEAGALKSTITLRRKTLTFEPIVVELGVPPGLGLAYQGELTPEELAEGCRRPLCVVGSYAVFDAPGAKIAHLPRPHAVDAQGRGQWLNLAATPSAGGYQLRIELPNTPGALAWWAAAVAPIEIDPTFGYTTVGGTSGPTSIARIRAVGTYSPASSGSMTSASVYLSDADGNQFTLGLYADSSGPASRLGDGQGVTVSGSAAAWQTDTMDSGIAVAMGTDYHIAFAAEASLGTYYYDSSGSKTMYYDAQSYSHGSIPDPFPSPWDGSAGREVSLYATYSAGGEQAVPILSEGGVHAVLFGGLIVR